MSKSNFVITPRAGADAGEYLHFTPIPEETAFKTAVAEAFWKETLKANSGDAKKATPIYQARWQDAVADWNTKNAAGEVPGADALLLALKTFELDALSKLVGIHSVNITTATAEESQKAAVKFLSDLAGKDKPLEAMYSSFDSLFGGTDDATIAELAGWMTVETPAAPDATPPAPEGVIVLETEGAATATADTSTLETAVSPEPAAAETMPAIVSTHHGDITVSEPAGADRLLKAVVKMAGSSAKRNQKLFSALAESAGEEAAQWNELEAEFQPQGVTEQVEETEAVA